MIILLYGKDSYRKRKKMEEIMQGYREKYPGSVDVKVFYDDARFCDIVDEGKQTSMFEEKRFVVIRDAIKNIKEALVKKAEELQGMESIFLFYEEREIKKDDSLLKELQRVEAFIQEFSVLSKGKAVSFLKEESQKRGVTFRGDALELIVDFTGGDLWRARMEIDKLSSYLEGEITEESVKLFVRSEFQGNIFKAMDALAEGKKDTAALLIYNHLQKGDHPLYILSMMEYQVRNLLVAKGATSYDDLCSKAGMHPFVAKKSISQASNFSKEKLETIHSRLFYSDLKSKTGQGDPVTFIHLILSEF